LKGGENMFTNFLAEVTPIITSSDWDVISQTATTSANAAVAPALAIMTILIAVPVAKKVFKKVAY